MKWPRWLAALSALLLLTTIVVTGAHAHHDGPASDRGCATCTLAHAPVLCPDEAPAPRALEPAHTIAAESPRLAPAAPLCDFPSPRAPPAA